MYKATLTIWYDASILDFTDCWRNADGTMGYYVSREYKFDCADKARSFAIDSMGRGAVKAMVSRA